MRKNLHISKNSVNTDLLTDKIMCFYRGIDYPIG